jgi:hypothetical protein
MCLTGIIFAMVSAETIVAKIGYGLGTIGIAVLTANVIRGKGLLPWAALCAAIACIFVFDVYYTVYFWSNPYTHFASLQPSRFVAALYLIPALIAMIFVVGYVIVQKSWRLSWFPLASLCLLFVINYGFDYEFMWQHEGHVILMSLFKWANPMLSVQASLKELNSRMTIEMIEFIRAIAVVWTWCVALSVAITSWPTVGSREKKRLIVWMVAAIGCYGIFVSGWWPAIPDPWNEVTFQKFSGKISDITGMYSFAWPMRRMMTSATHIGLAFAAFAIGLVVARSGSSIPDFKSKIRSLAYLLYPCAAVLLLHVTCMGIWQLHAAALLTDSADAELVRKMAVSIGANTAVLYVCILFVLHIPAVEAVTSQVKTTLATDLASVPEQDRPKWFLDHQLKASWPQFYADLFAVLSPLVASFPLAKLLVLVFS